MDWVQVITIILSLAGITYWFRSELKSDITRVESDISRLDSDMKNIGNKVDADMRAQSSRTDKLYEMFIQLQKENRDLIQENREIIQKEIQGIRNLLDQKPKTNP